MVRSPLTAASATFALKAGEWFRRGRLLMVSPVHGDYRRYQAEIPLIVLSRFPGPALNRDAADQVRIGDQSQDREDGVWAIASRGATIATLPRKAMNSRRFMDAPPRSSRF